MNFRKYSGHSVEKKMGFKMLASKAIEICFTY